MQDTGVAGLPLVTMVALTLLPIALMMTTSIVRSCTTVTSAVALFGVTLSSGCGGTQPAAPLDARIMEARRLAAVDLRCTDHRIDIVSLNGFAACQRREAESFDERGVRIGPVGRCLEWSDERASWPFEGWAATGCGFVEEYLDACGHVVRAERVVPGIVDCATF